jgi:preprotein translocase subunit YajC
MDSFVFYLLMGAPAGAEGAATGNPMLQFLPFIAIIGIFYFLIIRPQSKKQKDTQKMLSALKKGDRVVTIGGIHGVIQTVREQTVIVKVDESTKLEINRSAVSTIQASAKEDKNESKNNEEEKKEIDDSGEKS